jgi:hypothetical protein
MTTTTRTRATPAIWALSAVNAALVAVSGSIHLNLWLIAYRHVKTLDVLFLVQVAAALLTALALIAVRHRLVVAAALALMVGTIVGFILVRTVGLFGFKLTFSSGEANLVLVDEIVAVIMLAITGWLLWRPSRS